ncbi:hypothetical protein [Pontiella sulfatireligans]|uniref:hypothetical protein n=1 Tax=Pontiella sulfatireligans TaxID=2750658 RepID=UPI001C9E582E|nr:hypothetical protein [Pontiella sulfatireligans]
MAVFFGAALATAFFFAGAFFFAETGTLFAGSAAFLETLIVVEALLPEVLLEVAFAIFFVAVFFLEGVFFDTAMAVLGYKSTQFTYYSGETGELIETCAFRQRNLSKIVLKAHSTNFA